MTPEVRVAGTDFSEWEALHALLTASFAGMAGRIDPPSSLDRMDAAALRAKAETETLLLIRDGSQPVGCLFCADAPPVLSLGKLAVAPAHRGHGFARALLAQADGIARSRGLAWLELRTRIELTENHATFARLGFEIVRRARHPGYDRTTSLVMRRGVGA